MESKFQITACTISERHCRCFDTLTAEEKQLLEDNSVSVNYRKGEVICKQGGFVTNIMLVESGLAKVYMETGSSSLVLKIIPEGNFIGIAAVSDEQNLFQYSAMTYVDSVIRQIDLGVFSELLRRNPSFSKEVIDILSSNSLQIYGRFFCLTQKQAYGRLADIILCLSQRIFKNDEFELPLSRKDLAELSGMSTETVIRMLNKFTRDGLIAYDGRKFKVLQNSRLQHISETG